MPSTKFSTIIGNVFLINLLFSRGVKNAFKRKNSRLTLCGELALLVAVIINSFSVVLMLYSGSGISAISSVPFAFSEAFPKLTLGT